MSDFYKGEKGCLRMITDILGDYDGCHTVKSLKEMADEVREMALKGIKEGKDYNGVAVVPLVIKRRLN